MTCCSLPVAHEHYPGWLRYAGTTEHCKCGSHPRRMGVESLLQAWGAGR